MNLKLITFGAGSRRWNLAASRLARQASRTGWFFEVSVWTEKSLRIGAHDFYAQHKDFMHENPRGFGYWIWRPSIILRELEKLRSDQLLLFLDAGCELNANQSATRKMHAYFDFCQDRGMLAMETRTRSDAWIKRDLINHWRTRGLRPHPFLVEPGVLLLRRTQAVAELLNDWMATCVSNDYHYVDDTPSTAAELTGFVEHRHDQAVLTGLVSESMLWPIDTYFPGEWRERGSSSPIWAMRNSLPFITYSGGTVGRWAGDLRGARKIHGFRRRSGSGVTA